MALTATLVAKNNSKVIMDIAGLDADTTANFAHGLSQTPTDLKIVNLQSVALVAMGNWSMTADAANLTVNKLATVGSATGLGNVVRVIGSVVSSQN
jgi:hypothetical protein